MHIVADTLDDLLLEVYKGVLDSKSSVRSTKGKNRELIGAVLEIKKPRARLSRTDSKGTAFSCLGETLWYLAGSDRLDFIRYYIKDYKKWSDDGKTVFGAYGPRLFRMRGKVDQIQNIICLLKRKKKRETRQAVVQLFNAEDLLKEHKDIPCTCILQFLVRGDTLHMVVYMRSNDAYKGLPHDVFAFTFLQELVARSIKAKLGSYKHMAGSLHLYDENKKQARAFIEEGWQEQIEMPPMPDVDPWSDIKKLLAAEQNIRLGKIVDLPSLRMKDYWSDLVRLLQIFACSKKKEDISEIAREMHWRDYTLYVRKKAKKPKKKKSKKKTKKRAN